MEFERILFPVDFSDHSESCLEASKQFLDLDRTHEVHFLFVLHTPDDFSNWEGNPTKDVECRLEEFVEELNPARNAKERLAVITGHPSTEVCKYAAKHHCDLIVMATHGRTGLAHMILGSTAEQVVRHAPCPVLTLRIKPQPTHAVPGSLKTL